MTNREIDALVAEKVFGIVIVDRAWPCGPEPECGCYEAAMTKEGPGDWHSDLGPVYSPHEFGWPPDENGYASVEPVQFYSTDSGASKRLRKKMTEMGWNYRLAGQITGRFNATFQRGTHRNGRGYGEYESDAEELSFALAALTALGVEVSA